MLSIDGIGPKSVDCVRLLTLRNLAFPVSSQLGVFVHFFLALGISTFWVFLIFSFFAHKVDINVARIAVRLGWVPLQPLPDGIQMHLLERF